MRHLLLSTTVLLVVATSARAAIRTETIEYEHGGKTLSGFVAWDDAKEGKRPGVLVVHEWWGQNDYVRNRAKQLAELGYVAFALDMYGKGVLATTAEEAGALATPFYADRALMRSRATAGLQQLASHRLVDQEHLAAIGYCFGGTVALELARSGADLDAVVTFHGGLSSADPADARNIKADVLVCNGADDGFISPEEKAGFLKEMNDAGIKWTFVDFCGAVHGFTNPDADAKGIPGVAYNARADHQSWGMMKELFGRTLAPKGG
ncbi:MAG: dienelactone hydrolase family protein [Phycisphaerales bacterium]|nr:dienelactone hydrolase family protein [Phycisphaerales bacterium]